MIKYTIHFLNPENKYSISLEFSEKDLPFKPDKPTQILEIENTYFILKGNLGGEYYYERAEGEMIGISQKEIDDEWYMILDWDYITLTKDSWDE